MNNLVIVLGSPLVRCDSTGLVVASLNTEMRATAAAQYYEYVRDNTEAEKNTIEFINSGGYNVGVRYGLDSPMTHADFSMKAFCKARRDYPSEAKIMKQIMTNQFKVPEDIIYLEEQSATTIENAQFCQILLARHNFLSRDDTTTSRNSPSSSYQIAILTNMDHMKRASSIFQGMNMRVNTIYAEDFVIFDKSKDWISIILQAYTPKLSPSDLQLLEQILKQRLAGNWIRSVSEIDTS